MATLPARRLNRFHLSGLLTSLALASAHAATVTYDADTGTAGAQDGAGAGWNTTNVNMWNGASNVVWPNTTSDTVIFGAGSGAAGAVTVGTVTANGITFSAPGSGNYTLGSGTITLGGTTPTITANTGATIGSVLTGTAGLNTAGSGTLTLTGNNTWTGATTISGGTVRAAGGAIARNSAVTVNAGATLEANSTGSTGLAALYYNSTATQANLANQGLFRSSLSGTAAALQNTATTLNFANNGSLFPAPYNTGSPVFQSQYSGMINIGTAGTYTFNTSTDDGSMVYINGNPVVANNFNQGVTTRSGTVSLQPGLHNIVVAYNNTGGGYGMNAQISGANNVVMTDINTTNATITPDLVVGSIAGAGNVSLVNGNLMTGLDNTSTTFSGSISGVGGLVKTGTGTLTLTGNSTMSGLGGVHGGTLQVGNGGATGDIGTSSLINTASLVVNRSGAIDMPGVISGTGTLTKQGSGTLNLTGINSYTGATTVSAGTLNTGGGGVFKSSSITVSPGATLSLGQTQSSGLASQYFNITPANVSNVNPNMASFTAWRNHLAANHASLSQTTISTTHAFQTNGSGFAPPYNGAVDNFAFMSTGTINISTPGTYTFDTVSDDGSSVWVNGVHVANNNFFQGPTTTRGGSIFLPAGIHNIAVGFYEGGGGHGFNARISGANNTTMVDLSAANATLVPDLIVGSLAGTGNVDLSTANLIIGNANTSSTFGGVISSSGAAAAKLGIQKVGTGTLTLTGANTLTGPTTISAGVVQLGAANALGSSRVGLDVNNGLTFSTGVSPTIGALAGTGNITLQDVGGGAITLTAGANNGTSTYSGVLSGTGGLTKSGTGTLLLTGLNTYAGATAITGGTLKLATPGLHEGMLSGAANSTGAIPLTSVQLTPRWGASNNTGGTNVYPAWGANTTWGYTGYINNPTDQNMTLTFGKSFDDFGYLKIDNSTIINHNTWNVQVTGAISLSPGLHSIDLRFGQGGGGVGPQGGAFANAGIGYSLNGGGTYSAITDAGNGQLTVTRGGQQLPANTALTMSNNTTFDTTDGTLSIGSLADANPGSTTGHQVLLGAGALTTGGNNASTSFGGVMSGATATLTKAGTGTFTLTGNNTYGGTTTVSGGTLRVGNGGASGSLGTHGSVVNNGNLVFNRSGTITPAVTISGTGNLEQAGPGTLVLSGNNTYAGTTLISGGTLQVGTGATTGTLGAGDITNNGTLVMNRSDNGNLAVILSGTGNLVKQGAGTLTLSNAANSYSGRTVIQDGTIATTAGGANLGAPAPAADALTLGSPGKTGTLVLTGGDFSPGAGRGLTLLGSGGTLDIDATRTMTLNGEITGNAVGSTFTKAGSGTFNLTGDAVVNALVVAEGNYEQSSGITRVLTTTTGLQIQNGGTYRLSGGTLKTDRIDVQAGGNFVWGAGVITHLNTVGNTGTTDYTSPAYHAVMSGLTMDVKANLTTSAGSVIAMHGSPTLYLNNGTRFNNIAIDGDLNLASAGDTLEFELNPYFLRPFSSAGIGAIETGSLPFITWTGAYDGGTFANVTGILASGFSEYTATPITDPNDLPTNSWQIEYDAAAQTIWFHYKVAGYVPEPGSFGLLVGGACGLRLMRTLRDQRRRVVAASA